MISLLGYTVLDSERALNEVQSALRAFLPRSQQALADSLVRVVANRGPLCLFGFFAFVLFSSVLFSSVRGVMSRVFQVQQERTVVRGMGVGLLMMGLTALFSCSPSGQLSLWPLQGHSQNGISRGTVIRSQG